MIPEPDNGYYGEHGAEAFVRRYGHDAGNNTLYFIGTHKINIRSESTSMTMKFEGFDISTGKITNSSGGIILATDADEIAAMCSFKRLLEHWGRKHAQAAYVKFIREEQSGIPVYQYLSPVWLSEGADFAIFLKVMSDGIVIYDPGPKITHASTSHSKVKARSQFRISFKKTNRLYKTFEEHQI